jgi:hypothetical protein
MHDRFARVKVRGIEKKDSQLRGLNPRSTAYKAVALPLGQIGLTFQQHI